MKNSMRTGDLRIGLGSVIAAALIVVAFVACGGSGQASNSSQPTDSFAPPTASAGAAPSGSAALSNPPSAPASTGPSQAPDVGGGTTSGDVPDNAVFLTYHQASQGFSIDYVEGWQVRTTPDGVAINDKDSSETVTVVDPPADVAAYISGTDLPALRQQKGFKLVKQNTVKVGSAHYNHLIYHVLAPPDPVTGKQVPSTVDRYYVPGPNHLAIVALSTPDGVDNVDAFRQMIQSFTWS